MTLRATIYPAIVAAVLTGAAANAAPIAPPPGAAGLPVETAQWRGGNWRDHPLMYSDNWYWHQQQWNAFEGARRGAGGSNACARFRSYDPATHTYVNRSGRRVRCR